MPKYGPAAFDDIERDRAGVEKVAGVIVSGPYGIELHQHARLPPAHTTTASNALRLALARSRMVWPRREPARCTSSPSLRAGRKGTRFGPPVMVLTSPGPWCAIRVKPTAIFFQETRSSSGKAQRLNFVISKQTPSELKADV
jgi:hypothetical protein